MFFYMFMYFWRNLKIFSMILLQFDVMLVIEYNNINIFRGIIYKYMIYLKYLFLDFKYVMILCVVMVYLMVIDILLFIIWMWVMSDFLL